MTFLLVFLCFFLSCKANASVNPQRWGTARIRLNFCVVLCIVYIVSLSVLFVVICVLYYCHRVATQLQLNISYHMIIFVHNLLTSLMKNSCLVGCYGMSRGLQFDILNCHSAFVLRIKRTETERSLLCKSGFVYIQI